MTTNKTPLQIELDWLRERGWTLIAIAETLGIPRSSVDRWSIGRPAMREGLILRELGTLRALTPPPKRRDAENAN